MLLSWISLLILLLIYTIDKVDDEDSAASDHRPVLVSAAPSFTRAPVRSRVGGNRRQVGFMGSGGDDETFRKVAGKAHSTTPYREEFTPNSSRSSQRNHAPSASLQWDHQDLGYQGPRGNVVAPPVSSRREREPIRREPYGTQPIQQQGVCFRQGYQPTNFTQRNPSANYSQPQTFQYPQAQNFPAVGQPPLVQQSQYAQPSNLLEQGRQINHPPISVLNNYPRSYPSEQQYEPARGYQSDDFRNHCGSNRKPPDFDGGSSFHDFLVQFELIADMNAWDSISMANELAACLRGAAVAVLSDLQPSERRDYDALVMALKTRFEPDNQNQLYRAQLKTRLRHPNESLPALAQEIRKLVRLSNPSSTVDMRESLAKDYFLDALNDKEMELAVFQSQARSLNEALRVAVEFEAFRGSRMKKVPMASFKEQIVEESQDSTILQKLNELCVRIEKLEQQPSKPKKDMSKVKCFHCGKFGHFKKDCFALKKTSQDLNQC